MVIIIAYFSIFVSNSSVPLYNDPRNLIMTGTQSFLEEFLSRLFITIFRDPKVDSISFRVYSSIEITPFTFDLDVGFIDTPGVIGLMKLFPYLSIKIGEYC
jgi:hypothetical protein